MKKIIFLVATVSSFVSTQAQTINGNYLDINNVKAKINSDGSLFSDYSGTFSPKFEVPQGSGMNTISGGGLWVGGTDASSTLKLAGQMYPTGGRDFWPGPISSVAVTDSTTMYAFNRVWKVNKSDIDNYYNWIASGSIGVNPIDSTAMEAINSWPATSPFGGPLAPFTDLNANLIYEPSLGETPAILGDQAIFFVYNDKGGVHGSGGANIGIEIQGMAYEFSYTSDSALYNTVFTNYKIINKSSFRVDSAFIGNWTDLDIGSATDDYVGSDVTRGEYYGYNGTAVDAIYGANPPAEAVVFLSGPYADSNAVDDPSINTPNGTNYGDGVVDNERLGMSKFQYFNNDASPTGNPSSVVDYYDYLNAVWKDGTMLTYGGTGHLSGPPCDYAFPGNSDPLGYGTNMIPQPSWDESSAATTPGDRRAIGAYGPITLQPGSVNTFDFAYVYGRSASGGALGSIAVMQEHVDSVIQQFRNGIIACSCNTTGINNSFSFNNSISIYPNPASENITINYTSSSKNSSIKIYDMEGRLVKRIDNVKSIENIVSISDLKNGLYLLNLIDGKNSVTKRFIKQ